MQLRTLVTSIVGTAALLWAALLWFGGTGVDRVLIKPFGTVVTLVTLLAVLFEKYLWRLPLVRSLVARRPSVVGTWRARLESSFQQPNGKPTVKIVYMVIDQTLTTLSVRMFTDSAHSFSVAERIRKSENDELFELAVVYQNIPNIDHRVPGGTGQIHFGSLLIPNVSYRPGRLSGHYWTDRRTEGKLILEARRGPLASSFEEAETLFA